MNIIKVEFDKLYNGSTFFDPKTNTKWVKVDETGAVMEEDKHDTIGHFDENEIIWVL